MSWVDIVIAVLVIVATLRGLEVGILRQVGSLIGFVTGFVVGVLLAPSIASTVHAHPARPLIAVGVVTFFTLVGAVLGRMLGAAANLALRRLHMGKVDSVGGAVFSALGALIACWLVAGLLVNVTVASLSSAIGSSRILAALDAVMPTVPSIEAKVQALFRTADFPNVFAQIVPPNVTTQPIPPSPAALATEGSASSSVVRVLAAQACGVDHEGTGYVVGPNLVITAAHVVAGAKVIQVGQAYGRLLVFDPRHDVAVIEVATSDHALSVEDVLPPNGTTAAIPGYPLDGPFTLTSAVVDGEITAQGRDIYNQALVTRHLVVLGANVEPGNSGSPVVVHGQVVAMVFSRSESQNNVAYAVTGHDVRADLDRAHTGQFVGTGACISD
jgi:uncharacterized membrane protein required for colicin V production